MERLMREMYKRDIEDTRVPVYVPYPVYPTYPSYPEVTWKTGEVICRSPQTGDPVCIPQFTTFCQS